MISKSIEWAKREHSPQKRLELILLLSIPFVVLPVLLLGWLAPRVDRRLRLPSWRESRLASVVGTLLLIPGWLLAVWTIVTQFRRAQGTPSPTMATQKLLVDGPFSLCRNPMALITSSANKTPPSCFRIRDN
jgi:protein-S-isoprenylcysteine O-methyltransferase Ste14